MRVLVASYLFRYDGLIFKKKNNYNEKFISPFNNCFYRIFSFFL